LLDFTSVARTEAGKSDKPAQIWIGKAKGKTLKLAMNSLNASSQERMSWSHLSTIILSDNALKAGILTSTDIIGRYQEIRPIPWIFGTKVPIDQLLVTSAFFNASPLITISHDPLEDYKQRSYIVPTRFFGFIMQFTEPATTILLPSLSIDSSTWKKNKKEDPKMFVDGAFAMSDGKHISFLSNKKLLGLRWTEEKTKSSPVVITKNGEDAAVLSLEHPKVRKSVRIVNGIPKYQLHIKLSGNVTEVLKEMTKDEIEKKATEVVRTEILTTYQDGLKMKSDLFSLEHLLFKHETRVWKKLKQSGQSMLDENSLDSVSVEIYLDHIGMKFLPLE
jgi:Ger(x)C family germination protein